MKDERYKNLRQENSQLLEQLSPSYKMLANTYIKKARGYATKTIDTEQKINDVLLELKNYDEQNLQKALAIPSDTVYIEGKIELLSKEFKDPNRWKTIIWLTVIGICFLAWFVISIWMRQDTKNQTPSNLKYEIVDTEHIQITWDGINLATEGYYVWMIDENGKKYGNYEVSDTTYIFKVDLTKEYTFYVKTRATDYLAESNEAVVKYIPNK